MEPEIVPCNENGMMVVARINLGSPEGVKIRAQYGIREEVKEIVRLFVVGESVEGPTDAEKAADGQKPVMITTDGIDRMGEIVDPKGVDLTNYKKNPVILFAHRYDLPPIGSAKWVRRTDKGIMALPAFADTQFAQEIKALYDAGHMKAWSIGFIPLEWEDHPVEASGKRGKQARRTYTKSELLEFSAVPVPANPEALSLAMSKGFGVSDEVLKALGITPPIPADNDTQTGGTISTGQPAASPVVSVDGKDAEIEKLKALLVERDVEIKSLKELISVMESEAETKEPILRIIKGEAPGRVIIRVDGASQSVALDQLRDAVSTAIDGRMRHYLGRVS